ncbi:hypothetical protein Cni_G26366 [Canna indica]|uniref:Uncharacterized protein n=1 Tax=Canna indica TaxID=4628 RepID=A0AAQ3L2T0_9LILI|nr:hypothetical protein Cni_G26366 [Canna indica]
MRSGYAANLCKNAEINAVMRYEKLSKHEEESDAEFTKLIATSSNFTWWWHVTSAYKHKYKRIKKKESVAKRTNKWLKEKKRGKTKRTPMSNYSSI